MKNFRKVLSKEGVLVEAAVIVELKAVTTVTPLHEAQLLYYLKLSGKRPGLLINFNVTLLKDGIHVSSVKSNIAIEHGLHG